MSVHPSKSNVSDQSLADSDSTQNLTDSDTQTDLDTLGYDLDIQAGNITASLAGSLSDTTHSVVIDYDTCSENLRKAILTLVKDPSTGAKLSKKDKICISQLDNKPYYAFLKNSIFKFFDDHNNLVIIINDDASHGTAGMKGKVKKFKIIEPKELSGSTLAVKSILNDDSILESNVLKQFKLLKGEFTRKKTLSDRDKRRRIAQARMSDPTGEAEPIKFRSSEINDKTYLIMPHFSGTTLLKYLTEKKTDLTEQELRNIVIEVLQKLQQLYKDDSKIIHGDLHLGNIMYNEQDGKAIIIDYDKSVIIDGLGNKSGNMETVALIRQKYGENFFIYDKNTFIEKLTEVILKNFEQEKKSVPTSILALLDFIKTTESIKDIIAALQKEDLKTSIKK